MATEKESEMLCRFVPVPLHRFYSATFGDQFFCYNNNHNHNPATTTAAEKCQVVDLENAIISVTIPCSRVDAF